MVVKILLVLAVALAQLEDWEYKFRRCPHVNKLDSIDLSFFNNKFHQILRTKGFPLILGQCFTSTNVLQPDNTVAVHIEQVFRGMILAGDAVVNFDFTPGHLGSYTFSTSFGSIEGHYVDTDFETYFMVYLCQNEINKRRDLLEVYSTDVNFNYEFLLPKIYDLKFTDSDIEEVDNSLEACRTGPI